MSDTGDSVNPLIKALPEDPIGRARRDLEELRDHWRQHGVSPFPAPIVPADHDRPRRHWYPEPEWVSGWAAFELLRLQTEPHEWAPPIARICQTISDQTDPETDGLNYVIETLPPNHALLQDFEFGSNHWFRALYYLLTLRGADNIDGWETLVSDLYDWIGPYDSCASEHRICSIMR